MPSGSVFSATQTGKGLEALRQAYSTEGYIDFVATPVAQINETEHIITLTLDIQEGGVYSFGKLLLDGVEKHPGDAAALTRSWNSLSGSRFDSRILDRWLSENQSTCAGCTRSRNIDIERTGREQGIADVHLSLPPVP